MRVVGYLQDSTSDGEGLRDVLFVAGCSHACGFCHNTESWSPEAGTFFTPRMKSNFIKEALRLPTPAVTLSGGDPLFHSNYAAVLELCKELTLHGINIWLYTGYTLKEIQQSSMYSILDYIDVLVDGKFDNCLKDTTLLFRGSSNQKIIRSDEWK